MRRTRLYCCLTFLVICVFLGRPGLGAGEGLPIGSTLPSFVLPVPESDDDAKYLGLKERAPFSISQIAGKLILIEVVNAH
ncbi:MAG: hypothetical protein AB1512_14850 [Thermodesulfobacteriota bacterium]